ncbi:hypothetical protein JG687_00011929 [Phytophthora cactorum]|uniref:C2 domain-containing protein n=1 Tax=Phytophthora cactorum TaxID=29920 RepID=A0A8T1U390_9STRA|nr:hypothetical protein JG687_00011929 [Phytophthora cactorum]
MSAVDDVAARIRRLEETRASKIAQLRHLQHELRFNAITGVDERLDNGQSVARLEVKVESGRNMLFKAGFLSGQRTYVRVTVEVVAAAAVNSNDDEQLQSTTVKEHKVTTKRPVGYTPRWSEILLFEGLPAAVGTVRVDVMQDERIGADDVVGTLILPLARLQDQRPMERWHVLKKNDKDLISEILFSCRFQRSPGKEVVPEKTPERTASTRFSAVASFPPNMRKRESEENVSMNVEMHEAPRAKRQRVMDTEKQVNSLSDRIANWLLPAAPLSASTPAAKTEGDSVAPQQTPSALQAIEKWLFTDKDGNPRELPFGRQAPSY